MNRLTMTYWRSRHWLCPLLSFLHLKKYFLHSFRHSLNMLIRVICIVIRPSETNMPDRDPSETNWRPTCLMGDLSKTDMPDRRMIVDRYASSETNMPHWRPTCLIVYLSKINISHRKPIRDLSETYRRPIEDQHAWSETNMPHRWPIRNTYLAWGQSPIRACWSPIMHVSHWWVSDQAGWSPMGLQSGIMVSDGSQIRHVGLQWGIQSLMRH